MKAVIDDKIPFIRGEIEKIVDNVVYLPGRNISASDVHDADILIVRTRTRCDRSLLHGSAVRLVVTATIGFDHIDIDYCRLAGIRWTNCPGCNARSVCCYVMNAITAAGFMRKGLTLGIVGVGHVGTLVAHEAKAHGLNVLLCDPPRHDAGDVFPHEPFVDLGQIQADADIISFHTPLTHEGRYATHHLADAAFFSSLKRQPLVINASRGGVVDNAALVDAMQGGMVSDAVIDTWEGEPDRLNADLLRLATITTPHIAGYSANGKANATSMALQAVARFVGSGYVPHIVLPDAEVMSVATLVSDSDILKRHPDTFELQREHYPVRIEPAVIKLFCI